MKREKGPLYYLTKGLSLVLASIIMLSLSSCGLLPEEEEVIPYPTVKQQEITYSTYTVSRKTLTDTVHAYGKVVSAVEVQIASGELPGKLKAIYVKEKDSVQKGDLIAELYAEDLEYDVIKQRQAVQKFQLNLKTVELDYQGLVLEAKQAQDEYNNAIDPEDKANAKDLVTRLETQRKIMEIDMENSRSTLQTMREDLAQLETALEITKVYSPITGRVSYATPKLAKDNIPPEHVMFVIHDPSTLCIQYTPAIRTELTKYKEGMKIPMIINGKNYEGEITLIDNQIMPPEDKRFVGSLAIAVENLPTDTKVGELAEINVTFETRENVLVIPKSALRKYLGSTSVQLMVDDKPVTRDVEIGLETSLEVEVVTGLTDGDEVILK